MTKANTEGIRDRVRQVLEGQRQPTVTVLSLLLATQDAIGFLPKEAIEEVASFQGVSINDVWGVASFYTNFRFDPPAEHVVEVCWGPTCHLTGAPYILQGVQNDLGIDGEGDTADGAISLEYNTCLGACSQAPVISIDHRLHGRVNVDSARDLVSRIDKDEQ